MDGEIEIPRHDNYFDNYSRCKSGEAPCIVCGKGVKVERYHIHEHHGGGVAVTEERAAQLDPAADLGCWPIGPDCLRKHPELKPFVTKVA